MRCSLNLSSTSLPDSLDIIYLNFRFSFHSIPFIAVECTNYDDLLSASAPIELCIALIVIVLGLGLLCFCFCFGEKSEPGRKRQRERQIRARAVAHFITLLFIQKHTEKFPKCSELFLHPPRGKKKCDFFLFLTLALLFFRVRLKNSCFCFVSSRVFFFLFLFSTF